MHALQSSAPHTCRMRFTHLSFVPAELPLREPLTYKSGNVATYSTHTTRRAIRSLCSSTVAIEWVSWTWQPWFHVVEVLYSTSFG